MLNFPAFIGRKVINFTAEIGRIIILLMSVLRYFPRAIKDRKLVLDQMAIVGSDSLPLVILIGSFTGAIAALQATNLFDKFNLVNIAKPFIGSSIATVVFTELTPVLTALVIAGRVGASMAAQLGTMNVTEQIDALEMMGIDKNRYLAMPRAIATLFMMPVLAVFSNVVALVGGFLLTYIKFEFEAATFFDSVQRFFQASEVLMGLTKSFVFGGVTALIGVHVGFATTGGAEGVGNSTVRAFTLSAAAILIIDALFGYMW
ncbi:MAG: ABC transporter permease [Ignavibacteriae bacterium HGW-Ignavibacteriae-1]|jgi:phospholipid/cholesterol/gamma-HCH transport system permease protein|nr:MAG: ABC transporter permease [Ignavibacteriae bacterium HGW-Ignavibacteriae-1]